MENCQSGELSWWGVVLVRNHLVGNCPSESCPGGELSSRELSQWGVVRVGIVWWGLSSGELSEYVLMHYRYIILQRQSQINVARFEY